MLETSTKVATNDAKDVALSTPHFLKSLVL